MSAATILAGLHGRFQTLSGLTAILDYEPTSIEPPLLYSLLDDVQRIAIGGGHALKYRFLHRIVFAWVDNQTAEQQLLSYVDAMRDAIDPYLNGAISSGTAKMVDQQTGFVLINNITYRVLDSYSETTEKRADQAWRP